jgi:hypothetical protein
MYLLSIIGNIDGVVKSKDRAWKEKSTADVRTTASRGT